MIAAVDQIRWFRVEYTLFGDRRVEVKTSKSGRAEAAAHWEDQAAAQLLWTSRDEAQNYADAQNREFPTVPHTVVEVLIIRTGGTTA